MKLEEQLYESIITTIGDAITSEVGEEREFNDVTNDLIEEVSSMIKEALGLPEDHSL